MKQLHEIVARGVQATLAPLRPAASTVEALTECLVYESIREAGTGRQLLCIDDDANTVIQVDLVRAITGIAGVVGAGLAFATPVPPTLTVSALSVVAALGALAGLKQPLPKSSGWIVAHLHLAPARTLARRVLTEEFMAEWTDTDDSGRRELSRSLEQLEQLGCIVSEPGDYLVLKERVLIRW